MRHPPPSRQPLDDLISIGDWEPDEEFPYGPQGAKPKRILICPNPSPRAYLVGGHRYLFKQPEGFRAQQIWSEVLAYEIAKLVGVPVPPAFLAIDPATNKMGVLVEFFYGLPWEEPVRLVHAIDRLQGLNIPTDFRRGSLRDNVRLCRAHRVIEWKAWWAQTLAFDALIGNTDRHTENWGFLIHRSPGTTPRYSMAPAFDNGTSLGFAIQDTDIDKFSEPNRISQIVANGTHHFGWLSGDKNGAQHAALCRRFIDVYGNAGNAMDCMIQLNPQLLEETLTWSVRFNSILPFTHERAEFVYALVMARRNALERAIRG